MLTTSILLALTFSSSNAIEPPAPLLPVPAPRQIAWHHLEKYAFVCFGPNTFTDLEWGHGSEDPNVFNPTDLDCRQWAHVLKEGGMTQIVITAKHHDGFCLWPSKYSTHTVAQCKWRGGKGDVLRDLSEACKAEGLKLGIYLSPWDRNHPTYGTPEYNTVFVNMLTEVLSNYGPISEVWFDGANGEGPTGKKQVYDWKRFYDTVRRLQPNAVIFSDAGPDARWVGNEQGHAAPTNWDLMNLDSIYPGKQDIPFLTEGDPNGTSWVPAECDVSIRPGWFYHPGQDGSVKSPRELADLYYQSVGQNGNLILNLPPDRTGHIHPNDVKALLGMHAILDATFKTDLARHAKASADQVRGPGFEAANVVDGDWDHYWAAPNGVAKASITLDLKSPQVLDRVVLQEYIPLGQRVESFNVEVNGPNGWTVAATGTTIGYKRILRIPAVKTKEVRVNILSARACPTLSTVGLYASPDAEEQLKRDTVAEHKKRMAWFNDARFGLFIVWGPYSIPGGIWDGKEIPGAGEWIQTEAQIKPADYEKLQQQFDPKSFDAKRWVKIAKDAGMKYIVVTAKFHDGFAMWPSKWGTWNMGYTPFRRDPLKELATECKKQGIHLCFYFSIMDWHAPEYIPRRSWDPRGGRETNMDAYIKYMKGQIKELLTNYGPIGAMWFDGEWEPTWTHEMGKDLYFYCRSLQPNIIVNNRVDTGRAGIEGMTNAGNDFVGDFGTPENQVPANGFPDQDWETCMTMNDTWGYKSWDHNWKSATDLIRILVDCTSKGGNYLLDVGPTGDGVIPEASVQRLEAVGQWMRKYGDSIHGAGASPFPRALPWGRVTSKPHKLFLQVFDHTVKTIALPGLQTKVKSIRMFGVANGPKVDFTQSADGVTVTLPPLPDEASTVLVAELAGDPVVGEMPITQAANGEVELLAIDAKVAGTTAHYETEKQAIGYWNDASDTVSWNFRLSTPGEFRVQLEVACDPASAGSTFEVEANNVKVTGKVPATAGWSDFVKLDLPKLTIVRPGATVLTVRVTSMPGAAAMNLRSVRLIP